MGVTAVAALLVFGRTFLNWGECEKLGDFSLSSDPNLENKDLSDMYQRYFRINGIHSREEIDPYAYSTTIQTHPEFWEIMAKNRDFILDVFGNEPPVFCTNANGIPVDSHYKMVNSQLYMRTAHTEKNGLILLQMMQF